MEFSQLQTYLLSKLASTEDMPFGPECLVYKVCGKMFALLMWQETPLRINLKANPQQIDLQRTMFPCITPGYHMNKRHWNTVILNGDLTDAQLTGFIDDSYRLVVANLTKKEQAVLACQTEKAH